MDSDRSLEDDWPDYETDSVGHCVYTLRHGNEIKRCNAGDILRGLAADAEPALPVLIESMRSDLSDQVRAYCAHALADLGRAVGEKAGSAVLPLTAPLSHDADTEVRSLAVVALGSIDPAARESIPALSKALEDPDEWVRRAAQGALSSLHGATPPRTV